MKSFIVILFVSSCTFNSGAVPQRPSKDLKVEDVSRDLPKDTSKKAPDLSPDRNSKVDFGADTSLDQGDHSQDANKDLSLDGSPDQGQRCDGNITDLKNDPKHCGTCFNACGPKYGSCNNGVCECPNDATPCGNNICLDLNNDVLNCGACAALCRKAEECVRGACVCQNGYRSCGGECVDPKSNVEHCGGCNQACDGVCRNGVCSKNCVPQLTCKKSSSKVCARKKDYYHCGANLRNPCGTECIVGERCVPKGSFDRYQCQAYRVTIACTQCPCDECAANETCDDSGGEVFCLAN